VVCRFSWATIGSLTVSTIYSHSGEMWGSAGGGEGAVSVGLVAKLPGITLPRPDAVTQSQVVDTSKGLYKAEPPKPQPKEIEPDVKKIPEFTKEKAPHYVTRPSKVFEDKTPPPTNAVPYGQGGAPALPYSSAASNPANRKAAAWGSAAQAAVILPADSLPMWTPCETGSVAIGCNPRWTRAYAGRRKLILPFKS